MIKVLNLNKNFGPKTVLKDLSFEVDKGEILGIMGRNGAGKTTTIKSILRETSYEGLITIDSQLENSKGKLNYRLISVVSDTPHTYDYLTGLEQILFTLKIKSCVVPEISKIFEVLKIFGISQDDSNKLLKDYSFGMRRKITLIASFLVKPKLMILDEPTIGLDVPSVIAMKKFIIKASRKGVAFIITSHDPNLISELSSSILILNDAEAVYYSRERTSEDKDLNALYMKLIGEDIDSKISSVLDI